MIDLIQAAVELQGFCDSKSWRSCFIGGIALQRWGEPRTTVDVDLTLLAEFGDERLYAQELLKHFESRIKEPEDFAEDHRVILLRAKSGVGLDIALGALPFEEDSIERASLFDYPGGFRLRTCSAEDLVVMKAFASRPKDWVDLEGILVRQSGKLDWNLIRGELATLAALKESPRLLDDLEALRVKFDSR